MRIKFLTLLLFLLPLIRPAFAGDTHGNAIYHAFTLETDYGAGQHGPVASWDIDGWIGGDENKLWIKSEGENDDGTTDQSEFWALYSKNVSTFWDVQAGVRFDAQPWSAGYFVLGVNGLAPQFIETETHLFISDDGDVSARLRLERDVLLTQRTVFQPYLELNLFAQDVPERQTGAGLSDGEIGLQTRHEFSRQFAPYLDLRYERAFGETAHLANKNGEDSDNFVAALGVRLMF